MRQWETYQYIPMGKILEELKQEGLVLTRDQFKALEKQGYWLSGRTAGGWRRYTTVEATVIKNIIKDYYGIEEMNDY